MILLRPIRSSHWFALLWVVSFRSNWVKAGPNLPHWALAIGRPLPARKQASERRRRRSRQQWRPLRPISSGRELRQIEREREREPELAFGQVEREILLANLIMAAAFWSPSLSLSLMATHIHTNSNNNNNGGNLYFLFWPTLSLSLSILRKTPQRTGKATDQRSAADNNSLMLFAHYTCCSYTWAAAIPSFGCSLSLSLTCASLQSGRRRPLERAALPVPKPVPVIIQTGHTLGRAKTREKFTFGRR